MKLPNGAVLQFEVRMGENAKSRRLPQPSATGYCQVLYVLLRSPTLAYSRATLTTSSLKRDVIHDGVLRGMALL